MDLAGLVASLRRGGKVAGTMSDYGQCLKNVAGGTVSRISGVLSPLLNHSRMSSRMAPGPS
ncbi:hypothetical protein M427DRAFT_55009 [Gonapodya prolifera JEL478]|uniref:Uncharacterized protein n=1 Tax=Gonapodya prolifera (strain JEL478) TaxID=1344416 RepID=A0A139AKF1_GONPJ|nr:hypothetical protein M427DRAFT_55009 [Gonapodya prolifera JEL478]|eukprot:KXS16983.1 hypothetical protein M427DRAFT_55009 [Gonapodya prolifera JEL478]